MSRYARDPRSGNFVLVAGDGSSGVEIDYSEYIQLSEEARNFGDYFVKNVPINSSILPIGGQIPISELYDDTPTIGSLKPVTSDGIARNIDSVTTDMNVIELTTTAEHAHSVGDYFMLIGQFVKCIATIEIGDTIIIDTNVEATNIAEVLYQLNSKMGSEDISTIGSSITGAIKNLGDQVSDKNNLGEGVNLYSYDSPTAMYTTPSDGYIQGYSGDQASNCIQVVVQSANLDKYVAYQIRTSASSEPGYTITYVKKGMRIWHNVWQGGSGLQLSFHPFV